MADVVKTHVRLILIFLSAGLILKPKTMINLFFSWYSTTTIPFSDVKVKILRGSIEMIELVSELLASHFRVGLGLKF